MTGAPERNPSPGEARSLLRDHRVDLYETSDFIGDAVLERVL
jgi:hypothetical protein